MICSLFSPLALSQLALLITFHSGRIPGTGEPGGLPSMGSHRVGHDWSDAAAAAGKPKGARYSFSTHWQMVGGRLRQRFSRGWRMKLRSSKFWIPSTHWTLQSCSVPSLPHPQRCQIWLCITDSTHKGLNHCFSIAAGKTSLPLKLISVPSKEDFPLVITLWTFAWLRRVTSH